LEIIKTNGSLNYFLKKIRKIQNKKIILYKFKLIAQHSKAPSLQHKFNNLKKKLKEKKSYSRNAFPSPFLSLCGRILMIKKATN
jgi:hypothetical protein